MSDSPRLPVDPAELQRLLDDLLRRNDRLRQQAEAERQRADDAQRQADEAQCRVDELQRVLDQTAADFDHLKGKHAELAELLALFRRYIFGPRRERRVDDPGQAHLFDLHDTTTTPEAVAPPAADAGTTAPRSKAPRPKRLTRLDHLPQIRIEHYLPESE